MFSKACRAKVGTGFCEKDTLKQRDKAGRVNANERDML